MSHGLDHLPYACVAGPDGRRFVAVRFGDAVLDLVHVDPVLFADGSLDPLLAAGPDTWARVREAAAALIETEALQLVPLAEVTPVLGFTVADYVDFYASEDHAANAGRIFRPQGEALPTNWKRMPVGYHGRAGSVVVSGTPIVRPTGILGPDSVGPSARLDFEAEVGFVVGAPGRRIPVDAADRHVFGVCLLNDWSARDIQAFETVPLGPFLGKSFATSVSPWITPLAALDAARVPPPAQSPPPPEHLRGSNPAGLALELEIRINGEVVSRPSFADMYWTYAQMLAHLTSNGATARTGDLFASGTVSGARPDQRGCLLELTWNGTEPLTVGDATRTWLEDGDEVTIAAAAGALSLGEVTGRIRASGTG
jgi:fumarylacetoacetase